MENTVLLVSSNLFFFPRIKSAAKKFNLVTKMVTNINDLNKSKKNDKIQFILIDLEFDFWTKILIAVNTQSIDCKSIIAFGPHSDVYSFEKAKNLGCTSVLPKGTFSNKLPELFNE